MKKHYIDKGKSASGIPQELINTFDETVFEYSKKIYNFLINKFETEDISLTDKSLIDIEKIYEIIAKGANVNTGLKLIQIFYIRRLKIDTAL